ncbi:MAG: tRNA (adenosine(37)-N6)-threonylcarbamoyltransferase complex dimerization subunit type 1 TsaB [Candidatus Eremiobacteraeota bacterium]|nr:tRNA (adenosine(37)-N6)-threonylcarbamoyltransferase complex dimerization subunit type 1 TsaB [Candidatus Eremiobacteraeota bacterium]
MGNYIIGIDTSGDTCGVAFVFNGSILASRSRKAPGSQLVYLVPLINEIIRETGLDITGYSGVGVTTGPGCYTGLRLGLATAKTLSQIVGVPLVGLNTLDIIALNTDGDGRYVIPVMDARKKEFYFGAYKADSGKIKRVSEYNVGKAEKVLNFLAGYDSGVDLLGSGVPLILDSIEKAGLKNVRILPEALWYPGAETVAIEAEKYIKNGQGKLYNEVEVFYLREPDAIPLKKQKLK